MAPQHREREKEQGRMEKTAVLLGLGRARKGDEDGSSEPNLRDFYAEWQEKRFAD